jgi:hypothetical protein
MTDRTAPAIAHPTTDIPPLYSARLVDDAEGGLPFVVLTVDEDAVPMDTPEHTRAAAAQYAALAARLLALADEQQAAREAVNARLTRAQQLGHECAACGRDLAYADGTRDHTVYGTRLRSCAPSCEPAGENGGR